MYLQSTTQQPPLPISATRSERAISWPALVPSIWIFYVGTTQLLIVIQGEGYRADVSFGDGARLTTQRDTFAEAQDWCAQELRQRGLLPRVN